MKNAFTNSRITITVIIGALYLSGILSTSTIFLVHELHHILSHTMHLHEHDHSHNHHDIEPGSLDHPIENHGHTHNDLIDHALNAVNEKEAESKDHLLLIYKMFDQFGIENRTSHQYLFVGKDKYSQFSLILHTQFVAEPSKPPPKLLIS